MIRQTNNENGFYVRNTTDNGYLSHDKYPSQKTSYVGKYICLRYRSYLEQEPNNRFRIPTLKKYKDYNYPKQSGRRTFFKILRWDLVEPYRVILMSTRGEIIVTKTSLLESELYDLIGSEIYEGTIEEAIKKGYEYLLLNIAVDEALFFEKLSAETCHLYPRQDERLLGVEVISQYQNDLSLPKDTEGVINIKNDYTFTPQMKAKMIEMNPRLFGVPDELFQSFPHLHNTYSQSYENNPIRAFNKGYIIRADLQGSGLDPQLVVMEVLEDSVRFVTQAEAKFYYNADEVRTKEDISISANSVTLNATNAIRNFVEEHLN